MQSVRETAAWLKLMLRSDNDAATEYDLRGDVDLLRTRDGSPTMNMGYWRGVETSSPDALWKATTALFHLVAEAAELGPQDGRALDAGCGFGTNAVYCAQTFGINQVVGLNVSGAQLKTCRELVAAKGLEGRISFEHGSATSMPFPDSSFSKIVSIEAAFHFDSREDFFREARRVLTPGGLLALADFVVVPPRTSLDRLQLSLLRRAIQIPKANVYGFESYRRAVDAAGFDLLRFESVQKDTLPPYFKWLLGQSLSKLRKINAVFLLASGSFFFYPWDYVVIKARKRE